MMRNRAKSVCVYTMWNDFEWAQSMGTVGHCAILWWMRPILTSMHCVAFVFISPECAPYDEHGTATMRVVLISRHCVSHLGISSVPEHIVCMYIHIILCRRIKYESFFFQSPNAGLCSLAAVDLLRLGWASIVRRLLLRCHLLGVSISGTIGPGTGYPISGLCCAVHDRWTRYLFRFWSSSELIKTVTLTHIYYRCEMRRNNHGSAELRHGHKRENKEASISRRFRWWARYATSSVTAQMMCFSCIWVHSILDGSRWIGDCS